MSFFARALRFVLRVVLVLGLLVVVVGAGGSYLVYREVVRGLPDLRKLEDFRPSLASRVLDRNGRPIGEFYEERRRLTPVGEMPKHVVLAFVAGEDDAFFQHTGLDYRSIVRAAWVNLRAGGKVKQGGSTITQQVAKSLLSSERSIWRKMRDMVLARRIEERFTKDEILYLYLNLIYLGHGAYGVGDAALTYFGKPLQELTPGEAAMLAGLPKAPSDYSPYNDPEGAEQRRQYVLRRMLEESFLTREEWEASSSTRPLLRLPPERDDYVLAGTFTEEVRRFLYERLGSDTVLRGGLVVETTLDLDRQRDAIVALRLGLEALERRHGGWRGPTRKAGPAEMDTTLAELGRQNGFPSLAVHAERRMVPLRGYQGLVTAVDPTAGTARVAFAPGVEREVALADVTAALPRAERGSTDPKAIAKAVAVGDVARFELRPVRATPPKEGEAEHDPESDGDAAAEGEAAAPSDAPPAPTVRLELVQPTRVEGAVFAMDAAAGDVIALVGGYDFERSEFDRATQARRQPGSAFKPFVYGAALEHGYTPTRTVVDSPVEIWDVGSRQWWRPENYTKKFMGAMTAREALARSINNATIRVFLDVGVDPVIDYARRAGIRAPMGRHLSLALGSTEVTLLELTSAYATFAAGGMRVQPRFIRRVLDRDGNVLLSDVPLEDVSAREAGSAPQPSVAAPAPPPPAPRTVWQDEIEAANESAPVATVVTEPPDPNRAFTSENAYLMTHLLRAVIDEQYGTAHKAAVLGRPLAGKTGTTNEQKDAWFVGYSAELVAGVWVGHDEKHVLGDKETGGRAALPIWMDFMRDALAGVEPKDFPAPSGVVFVRRGSDFQPFAAGTEPGTGGDGSGGEGGDMDSYDLLRSDAF